MNRVNSKIACSGVLVAASPLAFAHPGDHGFSPWHHFLTSADHTVVLALVVVAVSVSGVRALRRAVANHRAVAKKD